MPTLMLNLYWISLEAIGVERYAVWKIILPNSPQDFQVELIVFNGLCHANINECNINCEGKALCVAALIENVLQCGDMIVNYCRL